MVILPLLLCEIIPVIEPCPRHRKPWHLLSEYEKSLYVEGFQRIRRNGKLDVISRVHDHGDVVKRFAIIYIRLYYPLLIRYINICTVFIIPQFLHFGMII